MTRIKLCGFRSVEHAIVAAEAGADFIGMVFAESRRRVDRAEAAAIVRALGPPMAEAAIPDAPAPHRDEASDLRSWFEHGASVLEEMLRRKRPLTVGVFAGNDPDYVNEIVEATGIDLVQLSGGEPWDQCLAAKRQAIKVVHVRTEDDTAAVTQRLETGSALAVMLDHGGGAALGGSGVAIDWDLAASLSSAMPLWLSGGLSSSNVAEAIARVQPWAVDVSSGIETDGVKDPRKIRDFVIAVGEANLDQIRARVGNIESLQLLDELRNERSGL